MIVKTNKANGAQFWACMGYPECKNTKPLVPAGQVSTPNVTYPPAPVQKIAAAPKDKSATMYVSYVKDLIIAGVPVEVAIANIKQAKDTFE